MRCPSCGYVSFSHLTTCKSCGKPIPGAAPGPRIPAPTPAPRPRPAPSTTFEPVIEFSTEDLRPAGFWIRFIAASVDGFVLMAIMSVFIIFRIFTIGGITGGEEPFEDKIESLVSALGTVGLLLNLVPLLYSVVFVGWRGQTPGKMLLGLKIIRTDGEEVGYLRAFIRWIGTLISSVTLCIGFLMAAFTTHKRALHDYIAGTRVIRL